MRYPTLMMMAGFPISLLMSSAVGVELPPAFSTLKPGQAIASPFRLITLPKVNSNHFEFVEDGGKTVLLVSSSASAATLAIPFSAPAVPNARLQWRWKISNLLVNADMDKKAGDDFAARLYVFFDVPLSSLAFVERSKIRLARLFWGADVPTAALCYVWDNTHPIGHARESPFTNRVRMIVLQSGADNIGKWVSESRDVAADFKAAFGFDAPAITGVAVGSDTDQTREAVRTWFGDVVLRRW